MFLNVFFFFNDTATTEIYTLSLHDALPISRRISSRPFFGMITPADSFGPPAIVRSTLLSRWPSVETMRLDRKSTRLNSSHANISYAVFCLKKKNQGTRNIYLICNNQFNVYV